MLLDVGLQGRVAGVSPGPEGCLALVGLGVTGFLSQVVKLEGDLVVRVKEAAVTQVSMLRYQDLQGREKHALTIALYSGIDLIMWNNDDILVRLMSKANKNIKECFSYSAIITSLLSSLM